MHEETHGQTASWLKVWKERDAGGSPAGGQTDIRTGRGELDADDFDATVEEISLIDAERLHKIWGPRGGHLVGQRSVYATNQMSLSW